MWARAALAALGLSIVFGSIIDDKLPGAETLASAPTKTVIMTYFHEVEIGEGKIEPQIGFLLRQLTISVSRYIHFQIVKDKLYGVRGRGLNESIDLEPSAPLINRLIWKFVTESPPAINFNRNGVRASSIGNLQTRYYEIVPYFAISDTRTSETCSNGLNPQKWQLNTNSCSRAEHRRFSRSGGGIGGLPGNINLLSEVLYVFQSVQSPARGFGFKMTQLSLASFPKLVGGSPQRKGEDRQNSGKQSDVVIWFVKNGFPPSQHKGDEQGKRAAKNAAIFFSGLIGAAIIWLLTKGRP